MKLLQRRLFAEFFKVFFLSLVVLLLFILMGRALQLREMLFGLELSALDAARLFVYLSPFFLLILCPVSCMLAVFMTFLRMGTDRELVALRAGGVSLYQMLPASLAFAGLGALLGLWLSLVGQGWGMGSFRSEVMDIAENRAKLVVRPGVFNKEIPNLVLFARQVDVNTGTLGHVLVEDSSRENVRLTILAPEGSLGTDPERGELTFLLRKGRIYTEQGQTVTMLGFGEYALRLSLNALFKGLDLGPLKPKEMGWNELMAMPVEEIFQENKKLANKILVERHKRWVFPAACIVLCIFAIPIAASFQGLQQQSGLVLALVLFLVYYSLLFLGMSVAESGAVPVACALWLPNVLFLGLGIWGFYLAANERLPRVPFMFTRSRRKIRSRQNSALGNEHSDVVDPKVHP